MAWRIQNQSAEPIELLEAWLPHDQFFAERAAFAPPLLVAPGESASFEGIVACAEPPGASFDNAYLVLRLAWRGVAWRVYARLRVEMDSEGTPHPQCQAVTVQRVGFSARGLQREPEATG